MQRLEEGLCDKRFGERVALEKMRKRNAERAIQTKKTACLIVGRHWQGMEWHVERNASWKKLKRNQESGVCGVAKESASRFWRVCV